MTSPTVDWMALIPEQTMLIFVACLCGAGILLSFVARYPAILIAAAVLMVLTLVSHWQGWAVSRPAPLAVTLLVEVVAIQVGYAIGVLGRSILGDKRPSRPVPEASREINVGRPNV